MMKKWKKWMAAVCTASMLVIMPGMGVLANEIQEEAIVTEAEVPQESVNSVDSQNENVTEITEEIISLDEVEEAVGESPIQVGDGVTATFDMDTGAVEFTSKEGTLWRDWVEKLGVDRNEIKSIRVASGTVYLPADSSGYHVDYDPYEEHYYLFADLEHLTTLDLSNFDTSYVTDMSFMFYDCNRLTTLNLSNFDTSNVTDMGDMFSQCYNLTNLDLSSFNTTNVTNMSQMFFCCSRLTNLDLSSFDTSNVTHMYGMFAWSENLEKLDISSFDTSNVIDMSTLFLNCSRLTNLNLSRFNTLNVMNMSNMFTNCTGLANLDLSSFDISNVTNMERMFYGCSSLTNLDLSSFDTSNVTNMIDMFDGCNFQLLLTPKKNSKSIDLPITMYDGDGNSYTSLPNTTKSIVLAKTQQMAQDYENRKTNHNISKYFITDADRFLLSDSVQRTVMYLTTDKNFANSCYVEQVDSDFFTDFVAAETNMLFRGLDGWRDIFSEASKVEKAEEILVGLLQSYEAEVNELARAKTAQKWADCYLDGLKLYMSAHALSNKSLDQITNKDIIEQLQKGEFDEIVDYLVKNKSLDTEAVNALKEYHTSQYFADGLSEGLDFLDTGLTIAQLSLDTVNRIYKLEALAETDEVYCEMLLYLSQNCNYEVVQRAAQNLYNVIHGNYKDQLLYVTVALQNEAESQILDKTLDKAAEAIPYGIIIKGAFDFSVDAANLLFKTGSVQEEKDCMRICTFVGRCLSKWVIENRLAYSYAIGTGDEVQKQKCARLFCYSLYMLAESRGKGEESIQSMLKKSELPFWKMTSTNWYKSSEYSLSKVNNIINSLKSEKGFKFYCSTVVSCPVNIEIYNTNGTHVETVHDGRESSDTIGEVSYDVYYNPIDGDYDKIIHFPENEGYSIKIIGTDMGEVDCQISSINEDGIIEAKAFDNIPISQDDVIRIDDITADQQEYSIIRDEKQEKQMFNDVAEIYKEVKSITLEKHELELEPESKVVMSVLFLPADASSKAGYWTSSDESVAEINKEGVINAHKEGSTILTCTSYDSDSVFDSCKVIVKN